MEICTVRKDITYKVIDDIELGLDLYYPTNYDGKSQLPTVVFAHGEAAWEMLNNAKDWGQYRDWGQLAAASGMIESHAQDGLVKNTPGW